MADQAFERQEMSDLFRLLEEQVKAGCVEAGTIDHLRQIAERREKAAQAEVAAARAEAAATRARTEAAVKALAESEQRYRIMGETIPFGVWWCNPQGEAEYVSPSFLDLLNMTLEEQKKFGWTQRLVPEDVEPMMRKWMHCVATGTPWDHEHRVIDRYGDIHTVWSKGLPVRDELDRIIAWVGVNLDMTARKRMEIELQEAKRALEEALHVKDEFLANISHELRTPLTLILGPVQNLLAAANLTDQQRHDLAVVARNARTLLKHVNDLLDLSRLDAGRMTITYADTDLGHLARFVASHFESVAAERRIGFTTDIPPALPAQVDAEKLQRVLFNLLANAFKFTPEHGEVRLQLRADGARAIFAVEDTGPGIPEAARRTVFERFQQLDASATRRHGGTGLGLAIVQEFVRLHGGAVAVGEGTHGGARFTVEIPLHAPAGAEVRPAAELTEPEAALGAVSDLHRPTGGRPRVVAGPDAPLVLVVEDNPEMNAFIGDALADRYRVAAAFDGGEGLEKALQLRPDLIVTDVMMPKVSGEDLLREVRRHADMADVAILVLTARADEQMRVALLQNGAQDVLVKPFLSEELVARVTGLIERKRRAETTLRENYALLHAVAEGVDDAIFVKDAHGRYLLLNSAGAKRLGKPVEQILGQPDAALHEGETAARIRADDERIMASGETLTFEESRMIDGRQRFFLTTKAPHRDSSGRTVGVLGVSRDITERKKIEDDLRAAKEAAEEASRAKDTFLINMSHELRTPLTVNMGMLELAKLSGGCDEDVVQYLENASSSAEDLLQLVENILELKSLQQRTLCLAEAPFDLVECCRDVLNDLIPPAEKKGLQCTVHIDSRLPRQVAGDCDKVHEVLFHLIGNAIKFTEQGKIEISIRPRGKDGRGREQVHFEIRDSGIGIPADKLHLIFQPFSQADPSLTRRYGGAGLGLAISRELIEQLGGKIDVQSGRGEGSVFSFTLPFAAAEEKKTAAVVAPPPEQRPAAQSARILVVEDDPQVAKLIEMILARRGHQIQVAEHGRKALEILAQEPFDLILMDLKMPVMDGYEATRAIRQKEEWRQIPIIALTAHARPEDKATCLATGMNDFLTKPVNMQQLYSTVEAHLASSPVADS